VNGNYLELSDKYDITFEGGILGIKRAKSKRKPRSKSTAKRSIKRAKQWNRCLNYFNHKCAYCLQAHNNLTKDHFIPISKGGSKSGGCNIVPACHSCNNRKDDHLPHDWCTEGQLERIYTYFWDIKIAHYSRLQF
jgi:hypothetical protein